MVSSGKRQIGSHNTTRSTKTKRRHANPPARFAYRHREKTAKQNKKRGQSPNQTPTTITQDLPSDTGGMSHRVIKNMHYASILFANTCAKQTRGQRGEKHRRSLRNANPKTPTRKPQQKLKPLQTKPNANTEKLSRTVN